MDDDRLLTIPEVARLLGISKERAYQMARERQIPFVRLTPRSIRVPRAAFMAWVAAMGDEALAVVRQREQKEERCDDSD